MPNHDDGVYKTVEAAIANQPDSQERPGGRGARAQSGDEPVRLGGDTTCCTAMSW